MLTTYPTYTKHELLHVLLPYGNGQLNGLRLGFDALSSIASFLLLSDFNKVAILILDHFYITFGNFEAFLTHRPSNLSTIQ